MFLTKEKEIEMEEQANIQSYLTTRIEILDELIAQLEPAFYINCLNENGKETLVSSLLERESLRSQVK